MKGTTLANITSRGNHGWKVTVSCSSASTVSDQIDCVIIWTSLPKRYHAYTLLSFDHFGERFIYSTRLIWNILVQLGCEERIICCEHWYLRPVPWTVPYISNNRCSCRGIATMCSTFHRHLDHEVNVKKIAKDVSHRYRLWSTPHQNPLVGLW